MAKAMGKLSHQPKTSIAFICLDLGIDPAPNANTAFGWKSLSSAHYSRSAASDTLVAQCHGGPICT